MKRFFQLGLLCATSLTLFACSAQNKSTKPTEKSTTTTVEKKNAKSKKVEDKKEQTYEPTQSKELAAFTYLFNGADVEDAKTIQRYVELTGTYSYKNFTPDDAVARLDEVKSLKLNGELAPDEVTMFEPIVLAVENGATVESEIVELGIFKDTTAEVDPTGTYDTTYQIFQTIRVLTDGQEVHKTSIVAMVWMKDHKIQASQAIADLNMVDTSESFFNGVNSAE